MSTTTKKPSSIDLSHHLSELSRARKISPLKGLQKYHGRADMISLAGGLPDPAYFPFSSITVDALVPEFQKPKIADSSSLFGWFWGLFGGAEEKEKTQRYSVAKYPAQAGDINLATALQYSPATGIPQLQTFVHDFTRKIHQPAYANFTTLVDFGNTDGITKAIASLCNPGEQVLVEEWTYPSMLAGVVPMNIMPAAVKVDGEGLSSVDLERMLEGWDETVRGAKRPHVLYTVPVGQNPTGGTMGLARKKAIYAICVKYDVIIVEDDPYFFLQEGTWLPKSERARVQALTQRIGTDGVGSLDADADLEKALRGAMEQDEATRFLNGLVPSFLRLDYQGRVVRLDSFSKIIAPGSRLGWITANATFTERFERQGETAIQSPCGFSQALIAQLITKHWGVPRFMLWLRGLQQQYIARRDFFVDAIFQIFDVRKERNEGIVKIFGRGEGVEVYTAYKRGRVRGEKAEAEKVKLFSFVPPSSGMFVWLKFHIKDNALAPSALEDKVWSDLAENGLLVSPGWWYGAAAAGVHGEKGDGDVRFRLSYSMGKDEDMKKGIEILARVLDKYVVN